MDVPYSLGLHEIAPDTYAYLQPDGSWGLSNAGLIVSGDEAVLVDTLFTVPLTRDLLAAVDEALPHVTIGTLVNSHNDGDHWWGNQLLPDAEIIASEAAAADMRGEHLHAVLAAPGDLPLPRVVQRMRKVFDFSGITPNLPSRTFSGELELTVGRRTVRLIEVGYAHTRGDVLVHVPDAGVLFTGDLLFIGGHPVVHSGRIGNWIAACDLILGLDAETIVPGHGPVVGKAEVRRFRTYLERVREHGVSAHGAGLSVLEAAREMDLAGFTDLADPERLVLNLGAVYRELNGDGTPGELDLMVLLDEFDEPRLAPRPAAKVAGDVLALAGGLESTVRQLFGGGDAGPLEGFPVPNVLAVIGHHPDLLAHLAPLLAQLNQGLIPPRARELAILRTAHRSGSPYEWRHHVRLGALVGLTGPEIARVPAGPDHPGWNEDDRTLLRAVDELHDAHALSTGTWQALVARHREPQVLELLALVGTYRMIAGILNSCRVPIDPWLAGAAA
ncbi:MBL fold metallo-hydrolase [Kitasatospora sp. SUK 42]|uniref:MBL fold metallo-hydrolase n=1 Tax=Kitasatospora sp. SUK 42 TaxID=1588882 RepID=UPI0018C9371F|nr:MBL fold metallo-hydrolase [Kitasatospora sp. SUK 42]MBV2152447.1 MBL fold metallo-hydrolase [Kitasatospora sp. SUK 42]